MRAKVSARYILLRMARLVVGFLHHGAVFFRYFSMRLRCDRELYGDLHVFDAVIA